MLNLVSKTTGCVCVTTFGKEHYSIVNASVEDAPNVYNDGDVHGSFIGVIEMKNGKFQMTF